MEDERDRWWWLQDRVAELMQSEDLIIEATGPDNVFFADLLPKICAAAIKHDRARLGEYYYAMIYEYAHDVAEQEYRHGIKYDYR